MEKLERFAGTPYHAGKRIFNPADREVYFAAQVEIKIMQKRIPAAKDNPVLHNISRQLGGHLFKYGAHRTG